jgi:hypothetical protein
MSLYHSSFHSWTIQPYSLPTNTTESIMQRYRLSGDLQGRCILSVGSATRLYGPAL